MSSLPHSISCREAMLQWDFMRLTRRENDGRLWDVPLNHLPQLYIHHTPYTAYVAVDFEGQHDKLMQMGVAVLPPSAILQPEADAPDSRCRHDESESDRTDPTDTIDERHVYRPHGAVGYGPLYLTLGLEDMMEQNQIEGYAFRILSDARPHPTAWPKSRERLLLPGPEIPVLERDLDAQLTALLTAARDRFQARLGPGAPPVTLVLVGYGIGLEYWALQQWCPTTVGGGALLSGWCDLQVVVARVTGVYPPSLTNVLLALGMPFSPFVPAHARKKHQAGNDVVRTLAVLLRLLHHAQAEAQHAGRADTLPHPFQHAYRKGRTLTGHVPPKRPPGPSNRPKPYSAFPFTVSVCFVSGDPLVAVAGDAAALRAFFAAYCPRTVTMHRSQKKGWVCLATAGERDRFVQAVHGQACGGGQVWLVRALSPHAKSREHSEHKRQRTRARKRRSLRPDSRKPGNEDVRERVQSKRSQWRVELAEVDQDLLVGVALLGLEHGCGGM